MNSRAAVAIAILVVGLVGIGAAVWVAGGERDPSPEGTEAGLRERDPAAGLAAPPPAARVDDSEPQERASARVQPAPETTAPTELRVRCVLPGGWRPSHVKAWFREQIDGTNHWFPARLEGDVVHVRIPSGRGQLSLQVEGCVVERWPVDVPEGRTTTIGPYELRRAPPLRGRVVDEEGGPVTDAFVYPKVGEHTVALEGTDDDGYFAFDGLPEGSAVLRVECETMVRRIVTHEHRAGGDVVEIVLRRGVPLRGRVLDEHGEPADVVYATVIDVTAPDDRSKMAFPSVEDDGSFDVRLVPGRYEVRAYEDGRSASQTVDVPAGRVTETTIRFRPK